MISKKIVWCLVAVTGIGLAVWGQVTPGAEVGEENVRHDAKQRYELFQKYLTRRAAEVSRANLSTINSRDQWNKERPRVSREMRYMLDSILCRQRHRYKPRSPESSIGPLTASKRLSSKACRGST